MIINHNPCHFGHEEMAKSSLSGQKYTTTLDKRNYVRWNISALSLNLTLILGISSHAAPFRNLVNSLYQRKEEAVDEEAVHQKIVVFLYWGEALLPSHVLSSPCIPR